MPKTFSIFLISLITFFIIIGLFNQISSALTSSSRLDEAVDEVSKLQDQNRMLKERLSKVQEYRFMEEIARDKLQMAKPGETVVIISEEKIQDLLQAQNPVAPIKLPNWQVWLRLFFR